MANFTKGQITKETVIGCDINGFSITGGMLYPSIYNQLTVSSDMREALVHNQAILASLKPNKNVPQKDINARLLENHKALAKANGKIQEGIH